MHTPHTRSTIVIIIIVGYHSTFKFPESTFRVSRFRVSRSPKIHSWTTLLDIFEMHIFCTGQPGCGKTTLIRRCVREIVSHHFNVAGFVTDEVLSTKSTRSGFDVVSLRPDGEDDRRGVLSRKTKYSTPSSTIWKKTGKYHGIRTHCPFCDEILSLSSSSAVLIGTSFFLVLRLPTNQPTNPTNQPTNPTNLPQQ